MIHVKWEGNKLLLLLLLLLLHIVYLSIKLTFI